MIGAERTFANAYRPEEDIIRYNRASKVYKVKPGDYASLIGVNHERNELTVRLLTAAPSPTTPRGFQASVFTTKQSVHSPKVIAFSFVPPLPRSE